MEIQKLKSDVVDKIAAGEVVERPSHLLKELLENSIDAGATILEIEVNSGGKEIIVTDNGKGVLPEELPLVFARHATSKITQSDDLWNLNTFGFRGEALASISSVSRLNFVSRRKGEKQAYKVNCDFGNVGQVLETSFQEGTKVHVAELFSNIPARLKFLKSDSAEVTQIKNVIKAIALQYPQIEIKFKNNNKLIFFWPSEETAIERVKKVLETERLFENHYSYEGFNAHVIFSDPSTVVKVSRQIWTFVQNRWVQDRGLQAAVMEAYRSLLMHGQYPICFVSVECPPDEVDVNIHPTKSQVKFVDSKKAFRAVHYALREAIEKAPWNEKGFSANKATPSFKAPVVENVNQKFSDESFQKIQYQKKNFAFREKNDLGPKISFEGLKEVGARQDFELIETIVSVEEREEGESLVQNEKNWSRLQVIGQLDLTYIVTQSEGKMVLVDQHAAHERVAFEKLMKGWKEGGLEIQSLLIPLTLDMEESEVEALLDYSEDLEKMGIAIEQEGPASFAVSTLPSLITEKALAEVLNQLAQEIMVKGGSFALETKIGDLFATMACHSVIRAGQALSINEMESLLNDMDEFPLSGFCPHGRSVAIEFSFNQIEKDFGRRV